MSEIMTTNSPIHLDFLIVLGLCYHSRSVFSPSVVEILKKMCPLSCGIWIEQHNRGPFLQLAECLSLEYKLCQSFYHNDPHNNFKEVRFSWNSQAASKISTFKQSSCLLLRLFFRVCELYFLTVALNRNGKR